MSDLKEFLDRGIEGFEPVEDWFEGTKHHVRRRQRNRRILSGVLAVMLAVGTGGGLWAALTHRSPTVIGPSPPANIEEQIRLLQSKYDSLTVELRNAQVQVTSAEKYLISLYQIDFGMLNTPIPSAKSRLAQATASVHAIELKLQSVLAQLDPLVAQLARAGRNPVGTIGVLRNLPIKDASKVVLSDQGLYVLQGTLSGYRVSLADPVTGEIVSSTQIVGSGAAVDLAVAFGSVWVATNYFPSGVQRSNVGIDRLDDLLLHRIAHIPSPAGFESIRATSNAVWALETDISQIDPGTNTIVQTLKLPDPSGSIKSFDATTDRLMIATSGDTGTGTKLLIVDAVSGSVLLFDGVNPGAPSFGDAVWMASANDHETLIDLFTVTDGGFLQPPSSSLLLVRDGQVVSRTKVEGEFVSFIAANPDGSGWIGSHGGGLASIGSDGTVRTPFLSLEPLTAIGARPDGTVYAATQSSIVVVAFRPGT